MCAIKSTLTIVDSKKQFRWVFFAIECAKLHRKYSKYRKVLKHSTA